MNRGVVSPEKAVPWDLSRGLDLRNPPDFSLVLGGPLYQLLLKARLSDDALMMVRQRVVVLAAVTWLPLLVLSALGGNLWSGDARVPFLHDVDVHVRFLAAMPLLIVAELVVHRRLRPLLVHFGERDLIPAAEMPRFEAAIAAAFRLRNSVLAEVLLVVFVYAIGIVVVWRHYIALDTATWYATPSTDGTRTHARRLVVQLRESADLPVPAVPLVLPAVRLDAVSLAGIAHPVASASDASRSRRRSRISIE